MLSVRFMYQAQSQGKCALNVVKLLALEAFIPPGVGRIIDPKEVHVLIPGTCEYDTLWGIEDFEDVI